jgi:hypothetical protein
MLTLNGLPLRMTANAPCGDFLRSTLSWQRNVKVSESSETPDRNISKTAHQINLSVFAMGQSIARFAGARLPDQVCDSDTLAATVCS